MDSQITKIGADEDALPYRVSGWGLPSVDDLPDPLSEESLRDENMFAAVAGILREIVRSDNSYDAEHLLKKMRFLPSLERSDPGTFAKYLPFWLAAKFVSLHVRKEEEIAGLIQNHILEGLRTGLDLKAKLISALTLDDVIVSDGEMPRKLLLALSRNEENLGSRPVKNWIDDYNAYKMTKFGVGTGRPGGLEKVSFMSNNENVRQLSQDERQMLSKLLEFYDWLRYGPMSAEELLGSSLSVPRFTQPTPVAPRPPVSAPVVRVLPTPPRPPAPPPKKPIDEGLYQSTLEELKRMRDEQERLAAPPVPQRPMAGPPPASVRPPIPSVAMPPPAAAKPPLQAVPISRPAQAPVSTTSRPPVQLPTREPFSVNEAIIHAGQVPTSEQGGIVPPEEYADQKLEDLRDKTKGSPPPPAPPESF